MGWSRRTHRRRAVASDLTLRGPAADDRRPVRERLTTRRGARACGLLAATPIARGRAAAAGRGRPRPPVRQSGWPCPRALVARGPGVARRPTRSTPREFEVVGRDDRVAAFERLQLPVAATLSRASTIKVGLAVGATAVVVGRIELDADELIVTARVVRLDNGRLMPTSSSAARSASVFPLAGGSPGGWPGTGASPMAAAAVARGVRALHEGAGRGLAGRRARASSSRR